MIAPSVLMVIDSPDSVGRTLEIGAIGRPEPMRGFTRPVATLCTPSSVGERVEQLAVALRRRVLVVGLLGHQLTAPLTSDARSSATSTGCGAPSRRAALAASARPPAEHQRRVQPGRGGSGHVAVEAVAHHQRRAVAHAVDGGEEQLRLGLAHQLRGDLGGGLDGRQQGPGPRPQPVGHGMGRVAARGQQLGAALHGEHRVAQVVVVDSSVPPRRRPRRARPGRCRS